MAVYKQPKSNNWSYRFMWNGKVIRRSTKQSNKRVAEQVEAAHKTSLAKGEVGIRERKPAPTLWEFARAKTSSLFARRRGQGGTRRRTTSRASRNYLAFEKLASEPIDAISSERIAAYVSTRQAVGREVSSINRELQVLRRVFP